MTAYVDESVRLEGAGWYVLAAVVVPDGDAARVRDVLRASLRRGQRRHHWYDERPPGRCALANMVASLGLAAVAVAATPVAPDRQERARRRCLTRLLWELAERAVGDVVVESRRHHKDLEDRRMIQYLQRSGWLRADLRYRFAEPYDEPLLWLPDIVAGAAARALSDRDQTYVDLLGDVTFVTAP